MSDAPTKPPAAAIVQAPVTSMEKAHEQHTRIMEAARDLISNELGKLLRLSQHPDWQNAIPIQDLIKLLEAAAKDFRLSTGQSTDNIAVAVKVGASTARFDLLTQEERNTWRELAIKAGVPDE